LTADWAFAISSSSVSLTAWLDFWDMRIVASCVEWSLRARTWSPRLGFDEKRRKRPCRKTRATIQDKLEAERTAALDCARSRHPSGGSWESECPLRQAGSSRECAILAGGDLQFHRPNSRKGVFSACNRQTVT